MLRVRKIGSERVQCVKMNAGAMGSFQRTEIENPIRGDRPDLMQIPDLDVRRTVQKHCARHGLARVFTTNVERETWILQIGRTQIECAIDRGVIACESKKAPISEVELELKSGQPARIYELAHRLNTVVPLRIETKSKAARGYDLVEHAKPAAPKCGPIVVNPRMSVRECLAAIAQPCVGHVLASANFACKSGDPEGIHQLRVAIRRMRAAFSIFHGAMPESYQPRLAVKLQTFARKLGAARDWDVLVEETIASMPTRLRKQRPTANLIRIAQSKRAEGDSSAHARDPQYTEVLLQLASWADSQFVSDGSLPQEGEVEAGRSC
jgi:inorganic triphosphatase YgiF